MACPQISPRSGWGVFDKCGQVGFVSSSKAGNSIGNCLLQVSSKNFLGIFDIMLICREKRMPVVWRAVNKSAGRVARRGITLSHEPRKGRASSNKSNNNGLNGGRKVRQGLRWPRCLEIARKGHFPLQDMPQQQQERLERERRQKQQQKQHYCGWKKTAATEETAGKTAAAEKVAAAE